MAFADPIAVTIDGTAHSLARVFMTAGVGDFESVDGSVKLSITPKLTKANRDHRIIQMRLSKPVTDPATSLTTLASTSISLVVDSPVAGFTDDEQVKAAIGLLSMLTASTNAGLTKFVRGEN